MYEADRIAQAAVNVEKRFSSPIEIAALGMVRGFYKRALAGESLRPLEVNALVTTVRGISFPDNLSPREQNEALLALLNK